MINKRKRFALNSATYLVLVVAAVLYSLPTLAMVGTAFKGDGKALSDTGLFASEPTFSAFKAVLGSDFMNTAYNSMKIGLVVTLLVVVLAVMAGYALSRFKSKLFSGYLTGMLVLQMFPLMLRLIPLFIIFKNLGIQNTQLSLVISYTAINLPFSILLLKGFFDTISVEIEESAMIDGCNRWQSMVRIVLPVAAAGIATVAIFTFLNVWNEYTFANVLVNDP
ncbi:carbohydrate ABC transporter permease, partial [Ruminococcaceae bacterium OttesenSCG-928-D13]|nr:carbohydrate ABC transporter permease [Ruminococcaceae bacterium OttesenSCG-928-D13]